jgi:superfamily II DNA or RNA helicase
MVMAEYYPSHYPELRFPIETPGKPGLRRAQLGALWAVASHFTVSQDPALVVMPTGSGKTAVIAMLPFLLGANRPLVVTANRLVRRQLFKELSTHRTLINAGVVTTTTMAAPRVMEVESLLATAESWEALREADIVVALPNAISPALADVAAPPGDLFDLLLVDEAHHEPAATWTAILEEFPNAKRALFTATATRRDRREVRGKFVYIYSVAAAQADGFFGEMRYIPVTPPAGMSNDVSVARAAAAEFAADQAAGLRHCILVRTDTKSRARELHELYAREAPELRLALVHSGRPYKTVQKAIDQLEAGQLDGMICVDMMSEGFDFPRLKIAAIHVPHRSLEVTLQFVGRFARTNDRSIGAAKFLAVPCDISDEVGRLFDRSADWGKLVANLSHARLEREREVRDALEAFEPQEVKRPTPATAVPLYALRPQFHVMVVETQGDVDMTTPVSLPAPFEVERYDIDPDSESVIVIGNERERPRWTTSDELSRSEYELFILYFHRQTRLLFIAATRRTPETYAHLARVYTRGAYRPLPTFQLNRVLNGMTEAKFSSVGMRSRIIGDRIESYRILVGSAANKAVSPSDGRFFSRGHVAGQGRRAGAVETIGYSTSSRVWSSQSNQLPLLIRWCRDLAERLSADVPASPLPGLDYLPVGVPAAELPEAIVLVDWTEDVYSDPQPHLIAGDSSVRLADIDLEVVRRYPGGQRADVRLVGDSVEGEFPVVQFDIRGWPQFSPGNCAATESRVKTGRDTSPLLDYLNSEKLDFYGPDLSRLRGLELFTTSAGFEPYPRDEMLGHDWTNVDITREVGPAVAGRLSVQGHIGAMLTPMDGVVVFDHGRGEIADFVHLQRANDRLLIKLYHCKRAHGDRAASRVEDVQEVCGQVVRSVKWVGHERDLLDRLRTRLARSVLLRGTEEEIVEMHDELRRCIPEIHVCLVQPGLSKGALDQDVLQVLAAARDYATQGRVRLHVMGSD